MNIVLDNIKLADQMAGGVSAYWCEIIKYLLMSNANFKLLEHKEAATHNIFRAQMNIDQDRIIPDLNIPVKILRYLPVTATFEKNSIFHSSYYRYSTQENVINITTVHDFTYEKFRTGLPRFIHTYQKKLAIAKSHGVICVSNNTKNDLLEHIPSLPESKITVIYHGIAKEYHALDVDHKIPDSLMECVNNKYIIYVGDRGGYKNFSIAVKALRQLTDYHLVIIGGAKLSSEERDILDKSLGKRYRHLTGIDNVKMNVLLNNAFCMIYPSCYEGFGMPIAEAMKSGCPVVTTNTSSIPEVGGDAVLMVERIEADDFIHKIKLLENDDLRREMIERGLIRSQRFSWEKMFKETVEFYERIYAMHST